MTWHYGGAALSEFTMSFTITELYAGDLIFYSPNFLTFYAAYFW